MKEERTQILWLLQKNNLTQTWLINRLADKGIEVCKTNLSDILRGVRRNETSEKVITASLEILEDYEKWSKGS